MNGKRMEAGRIQRGLRRRVASWLAPPVEPPPLVDAYYPQQSTCQVRFLWHLYSLFLGEREHGSFVEVGAYDGVFVSNTWGLAARGWDGWMVEPVPELARLCRENHAEHPSVQVVNCAIGPVGVDEVRLQLGGTLTTANPDAFREYENVEWAAGALTENVLAVPCVPLDRLLEDHGVEVGFDVLVVDVEGFESEVFSGFSLDRWRPKMMIVELADTHPDLRATIQTDARMGRRFQDSGYEIAFKDHVNTIFVRRDVWSNAYGL